MISWGDVFAATDVSGKVDVFNRKVLSLLHAHALLRPVAVRNR